MKHFSLILFSSTFVSFGQLQAAESKPNVLFIAVDDLRLELGCHGVKKIKSPDFDRFAASGIAFTHVYCQQAVCNPSRVSLLTELSAQAWKALPRPKFPSPPPAAASAAIEAGPALTWHPASNKPRPPSKPAGDYLDVTFINARPDPVELIGIGPDGSQKAYKSPCALRHPHAPGSCVAGP